MFDGGYLQLRLHNIYSDLFELSLEDTRGLGRHWVLVEPNEFLIN